MMPIIAGCISRVQIYDTYTKVLEIMSEPVAISSLADLVERLFAKPPSVQVG